MATTLEVSKRPLADRIADLGQVREYARQAILFHEGDRSDLIYVVLSGRLKVFLSDSEGREIVLNEMGPGEIFGEMSLDGNPRSASVITSEPSPGLGGLAAVPPAPAGHRCPTRRSNSSSP